jgi:dimethylsulfoniopropionate demethylase
VLIDEPDVSPLAVQGPLSDRLMARVFGDGVRDIRFFRFGHFDFQGRDLDVRAGCPNAIERVEGGLLSYGNDMTRENTPHECGLGRFCNTATAIGCVGRDALLRVAKEGPVKQIRAIEIDSRSLPPCDRDWRLVARGRQVGTVTSAAQSPDLGHGVGIGMVRMTHWDEGTDLKLETQDGTYAAIVREEFWATKPKVAARS